eukprot:197892-Prorocentrum_lima.AAC.1
MSQDLSQAFSKPESWSLTLIIGFIVEVISVKNHFTTPSKPTAGKGKSPVCVCVIRKGCAVAVEGCGPPKQMSVDPW